MSTKPRTINLPSNGMEGATKAAQVAVANKKSISEDVKHTEFGTNPTKDLPPKNRREDSSDDLQTLQNGIAKYTGIEEHGMSVWVVKAVKKRLDELKFRTGNKVGYRAFTNAALEFAIDKYGDEIVKAFTKDN